MICTTDRAQIQHPDGGFLFVAHREWEKGREDRHYQWFSPATHAQRWARPAVERFLEELIPAGSHALQEQFAGCRIVQAPICACCGDVPFAELTCVRPHREPELRRYRCNRHCDRNPCAIEGCSRTGKANGHYTDDGYLCSTHWKIACPPHSVERRAYHRFFRTAKKLGLARDQRWPEALENRFWRYWGGLLRRARRRCAGDLDMAEINKLFGWEEPA